MGLTRTTRKTLWLAALPLLGCGDLWGYYSEGNPQNCVRIPNTCRSDQFCNRQTQQCQDYILTTYPREDVLAPPTAPPSFLSPGGSASGLTNPRDIAYSIGTPVEILPNMTPQATIYYTLDGTTPASGGGSTLSGASPLSLGKLPSGTTIKWYSDYGTPYNAEAVRTFTTATDASAAATAKAGFIMENMSFTGFGGPSILVPRVGRVNAKVNLQAWAAAAGQPDAKTPTHVVISVTSLGQVGCFTDIELLGAFPGQTFQMFISFSAPNTLGRFQVTAGVVQQATCTNAPAPANPIQIGEVITQ